MSQVQSDCEKYLPKYLRIFKDGGLHDVCAVHEAIFSEEFPPGWFEIQFNPSRQLREKFTKVNPLSSTIFTEEKRARALECFKAFPAFLAERCGFR